LGLLIGFKLMAKGNDKNYDVGKRQEIGWWKRMMIRIDIRVRVRGKRKSKSKNRSKELVSEGGAVYKTKRQP